MNFQRITALVAVAGALLAHAYACYAAPDSIAISFDFYRHEVVVQAMIDGRGPFPMLLDTGTNPSVIDLSLARQLGIAIGSVGEAGSGGGTQRNLSYQTILPNVHLGAFSADDISALALDLSALSRRFGRPIQGVLGQSLLEGHVVQFDYPARIVRFLSAHSIAGDKVHRNTFLFHDEDSVVMSGATINGKPALANIDTGSNNSFQLTPSAIRKLGLASQASRAKVDSAAGFNGSYQSRIGTVASIAIGNKSVKYPKVTFWMPGTGHDSSPWDVNVGNLFLQNYIVTFDYVGKHVIFESPRNLATK